VSHISRRGERGFRAVSHSADQLALAIPAGFEPATHGVEIRSDLSVTNSLDVSCTNGVPSSSKRAKFHALGCTLVGFTVGKQMAVGVESHFDRRVAHEDLDLLRVVALLDPQGSAGVA
jgi:hypothetical protein